MTGTLSSLDTGILLWIQEYIRTPVITPAVQLITFLGNVGWIWIFTAAVLCVFKRTRRAGVLVFCALALSFIINNLLLKNIIGRVRPFDAVNGLIPLISKPRDASFPSGHSAASFAAAVIMLKRLPKRIGIPSTVLAVMIALSRLYLGVHYPTDVIFGSADGVAIAFAVTAADKRIRQNSQTAVKTERKNT